MAKIGPDEQNLKPIFFTALNGNVKAAIAQADRLDSSRLTEKEVSLIQSYRDRFTKDLPTINHRSQLSDQLISIYKHYWQNSLMKKLNEKEGIDFLFSRLNPLVVRLGGEVQAPTEEGYKKLALFLQAKLKEDGEHSLIGFVRPYLNLMIWKTERTKSYNVNLGNGERQQVDVILMSNFKELGWAAFATFERFHVGGWVGKKALHCVSSSYNLESEDFRVSFLAHEARHFKDLASYPKLDSIDLEYRAKLNEIILADSSFTKLMDHFNSEKKNNRENSHSFSSHLIFKEFNKVFGKLSQQDWTKQKNQIKTLATKLLREHTKKLGLQDRATVTSVLIPQTTN